MAHDPVIRLEIERYRGALSPQLCAGQQRVIVKLLDECKAQLAALDANAGAFSRPGSGFVLPIAQHDVVEQRMVELQEGLRHLRRLSDFGEAVASLLHELIQPLAAIGNYCRAEPTIR